MSDEPTNPADNEDRRDERLAAALEVPPLDDVTRRQLVRRALDESGDETRRPSGRARVLAVAAAVLAVLVIGGGTALILRDDGDDTTVASRTPDARGASEAEDAAAPAAAPVLLGDLGDVTDPSVLRERLATASASPGPSTSEAESVFTDLARCRTPVPPGVDIGPPFELATGTYNGAPVLVVAGSRGDDRIASVLDADTCQTLAEVPI